MKDAFNTHLDKITLSVWIVHIMRMNENMAKL